MPIYITEHSAGTVAGVQCVTQPPVATPQTVAITAGSLKSSAFSGDTKIIRVHCDAICSFKIGPDSTTSPLLATTTDARMAAGQTEYFAVTPGHRLAVISNS